MQVAHVPVTGEIIHTQAIWEEVAGGGGVAAMQLAELAGSCLFFTAVGSDARGERALAQLQAKGVEVYATKYAHLQTKEIYVHIDAAKERTITVSGNLKPSGEDFSLPWDKLKEVDAVYFVSGDDAALRAARTAKTLVSTARVLPLLQRSGMPLDALVSSQQDSGERYNDGDLTPAPSLVIKTLGTRGGITSTDVKYQAEVIPEFSLEDSYGCGDSFAAGLTFGLGKGLNIENVLGLAAHCGAQAAMRPGAFGNK